MLHHSIDLGDADLFNGTKGTVAVNNVVTQSESDDNGLRTVALGMAAAGEWTRRVALDVFAFAMSDYVVGVFLMLALIFLLILLSTDFVTFWDHAANGHNLARRHSILSLQVGISPRSTRLRRLLRTTDHC